MDKGSFIKEVDKRLGVNFPSLGETCALAVLTVLEKRVQSGQADHITTHLPKELKDELGPGFGQALKEAFAGTDLRKMDKHQFLEAVKEEAGFQNTDEAYQATRAVFGALKQILPEKDVRDTAGELPAALREIWLQAA